MNMHELGMNMAWTVHEVTMIVGINSMKYGPKFPNFMGVARENLLCFEHEHGHVHAQEPWTIFATVIINFIFLVTVTSAFICCDWILLIRNQFGDL